MVKLLDFGIARSMQDVRLTGSGEVFGTPQYMAPERITSIEAGPSADIYALGVLMFEMLTGQLPFKANDVASWFIKHMKEPAPSMRTLDPSLPAALDQLALDMMAKEPTDRPVDAHRVHANLSAIAGAIGVRVPEEVHEEAVSSRVPSTSETSTADRWKRRTEVFDLMLARAYPGEKPRELTTLLTDVKGKVTEMTKLRAHSVELQHQLETIEARGREVRQRFGHAVHDLGVDASRARDEAKSADTAATVAGAETSNHAEKTLAAHQPIMFWEGRSAFQQPYPELAKAYRAIADQVDEWLDAQKRQRAAAATAKAKHEEVKDIDFQIQELRNALSKHEENIEKEQADCNKRLKEMGDRADTLETELLELATRFCSPLRAKPELGPLFTRLEDVAA